MLGVEFHQLNRLRCILLVSGNGVGEPQVFRGPSALAEVFLPNLVGQRSADFAESCLGIENLRHDRSDLVAAWRLRIRHGRPVVRDLRPAAGNLIQPDGKKFVRLRNDPVDLEFLDRLLVLGRIFFAQKLHIILREHELAAGARGQRPGHGHFKRADRFGLIGRMECDADRFGVELGRLGNLILRKFGFHRKGGLLRILRLDRGRIECNFEFLVFGKKIRADLSGLSGRVDHRDFDRVGHRSVRLISAQRPGDRQFKKWFYGDRRRHQPEIPQFDHRAGLDCQRPEFERQRNSVGIRPREPVRTCKVELALVPDSLRSGHDCQAPLVNLVLPRAGHVAERAEIHKVQLTADHAEFKFQPVEISQPRKQRVRCLHLQLCILPLHQHPPECRNLRFPDLLHPAVHGRPHLLHRKGFQPLHRSRSCGRDSPAKETNRK